MDYVLKKQQKHTPHIALGTPWNVESKAVNLKKKKEKQGKLLILDWPLTIISSHVRRSCRKWQSLTTVIGLEYRNRARMTKTAQLCDDYNSL